MEQDYSKTHCKGNSIYGFPERKLRGLIPNFYIHISVSDLYIPRNGPPIFVQPNWQTQRLGINKLLTEYMNVEIRTEAAKFPYWEHFFQFSVKGLCSA